MNKYLLIFLFIFFVFTILFSQEKISSSTILVIIEEQENDEFVTEATPLSDGIFNALWEKDCIFFDMKINKPIETKSNDLVANSYTEAVSNAGADTLLLIKIHYYTTKDGKRVKLSSDEFQYNLYSFKFMKVLTKGTKKISLNTFIDSIDEKNKILKKTGYNLLNDIFVEL